MSSKAEKTSHNLHQQHRASIFFRNPTLLKIVAWLGSLSFIGSTGVVWADLKPISASQTETQALLHASSSAPDRATDLQDRDIFGPPLPTALRSASVPIAANRLPNREVPIAVAPASATILPTGKIVRPQHADLLTADNYTVGVNGTSSRQPTAEEFVNIPVPAPLRATIPGQNPEIVTATASQVRPSGIVTRSVPTTSLSAPAREQSVPVYRSVPQVPSLPTANLRPVTTARSTALNPQQTAMTPRARALDMQTNNNVRPGLQPTVVAPIKPVVLPPATETLANMSVSSLNSIEIVVPAPRTQTIAVQPVAQLPQLTGNRAVPSVPAIPSVRPAGSRPLAFANNGGSEFAQLIYPLTNPAPTTSSFGWRTHPITGSRRFHSGVDIGAPMGAPVVATGSGTIVSAGWIGGYGKAIVIQHNGVQQTLYGHLSEVFVRPGQTIEQGTVIGRVGSTGNSTGPHLHFETRTATADGWVAVDPGGEIEYALDNLRRSMPFAQRDLPPGYN